MNTTDLMRDPFYVPILLRIESEIVAAIRDARARALTLTDSQVRSMLNKVRKTAEGGRPSVPGASEREKLLGEVYERLIAISKEIEVQESDGKVIKLPAKDWILAVRAVEDSIRLRSAGAGSRDYLDYVEEFIGRARKQS